MEEKVIIDRRTYPKNAQDWWVWFESEKENIVNTINKHIDDHNLKARFHEFVDRRDSRLYPVIEECWDAIPESEFDISKQSCFILSELVSNIDVLENHIEHMKQLFKDKYEQYKERRLANE